jgi:hypothetical protein
MRRPGLFFDIILTPDCVCSACLETMAEMGLDPENPSHRLAKDEWVNERFRSETSSALQEEFPGVRIFYNCGTSTNRARGASPRTATSKSKACRPAAGVTITFHPAHAMPPSSGSTM